MKLNFKFVGYEENLYRSALSLNGDRSLYVLNDNHCLEEAKKESQKAIGLSSAELITKDGFKDGVDANTSSLISGNKRIIEFFLSLSDKSRENLKIYNFFDALNFSNNFFNFYEDMVEEKVGHIKGLFPWQHKILNGLNQAKKEYGNHLFKKNLKDKIFVEEYSLENMKKYRKIIFVGIIYFSAREREILEKLSNYVEILIIQQMPSSFYDERYLRLKKVYVPNDRSASVDIVHSPNEFIQSINMLKDWHANDLVIDLDEENSSIETLSHSKYFKNNREIRCEESLLYSYFEALFLMVKTLKIEKEKISIQISTLYKLKYSTFLTKSLSLEDGDLDKLHSLAAEGYKYLTNEHEIFYQLFNILEQIVKIRNFNDFYSLFNGIDLLTIDSFAAEAGVLESLYIKFEEMVALNENEFVGDWSALHEGEMAGQFFLQFYINILKGEVKLKSKNPQLIKLDELCYSKNRSLKIMNANNHLIPKKGSGEDFILMDFQKGYNGLRDLNIRDLEYRYKILRAIMASKNTSIFYIRNHNLNLDSSPLVEKLKIKWRISDRGGEISEEQYPAIINKLVGRESFFPFPHSGEDSLPLLKDEVVKENEFSVGFYEFYEFQKCKYKYYLKYVAKLQEQKVTVIDRIDPHLIGNIVHNLLNTIALHMTPEVKKGSFRVDEKIIKKGIDEIIEKERDKIATVYSKYYEKVLYPFLEKSVHSFYSQLKKKVGKDSIVNFLIEDSSKIELSKVDGISFAVKGKADLRVEGRKNKYIIDYKTGHSDSRQLDFYQVIYYNHEKNVFKFFYNFFNEELKEEDKTKLRGKNVEDEIQNFLSRSNYPRTKNKSMCRYCEYLEICRAKGR